MTLSAALLAFLLVTSAVATPLVNEHSSPADAIKIPSSPISLRTTLRINATGSPGALVERDRQRLKALHKGHGHVVSHNRDFLKLPTTNAGSIFTAEIGVGTPPTTYEVIVDTGSSNTFVGTNKAYTRTSSSKDTGKAVKVSYGSGGFSGEEFSDTVTLGTVSISAQSIGAASKATSSGFGNLDGILGLGPVDLTEGTIQDGGTIPTVTDNLAEQGKIPSALVGVYFPPSEVSDTGSLDFGVPDSSKFTGELSYVPTTKTSPSSAFWGIDQSIAYGDTQILKSGSGIIDTGTTLFYLTSDAFQAYLKATGAVEDQATGLLRLSNTNNLKSLFFTIGGRSYEFTANAQMWPHSLNEAIGGQSGSTYLIIQDGSGTLPEGMDFVSGIPFLQRFYTVFDTANARVGFATTPNTNANSN